MAQAEIGALRVRLAMDAGEFTKGAKEAEGTLDRLANKFGLSANTIKLAGAAVAASMVALASSIALGIKMSIDNADKMDELAQKLGLTVEELTRLKYASEIAGVPMESLTIAIKKMSVAMQEISTGEAGSGAARALAGLGVAVTDSTGALRSASDVMIDIADKFSQMKDGAQKTAVAMMIFGKSGAEIIPFLNQGRDGIKQLTDEADKLGITLSGKTAAAAGKFNENLDRVTANFGAFFNQLAERVLPALVSYTNYLVTSTNEHSVLRSMVDGLAAAFKVFLTAIIAVDTALQVMISNASQAMQFMGNMKMGELSKAWENLGNIVGGTTEKVNAGIKASQELWSGWVTNIEDSGKRAPAAFAPIIAGTKQVSEAQRELNRLIQEGVNLAKATRDPTQIMVDQQKAIQAALNASKISAGQAADAMKRASMVSINAYAGMASQIGNNLASIFGESKAVAIAVALINTAEAVTKTLATYGATPWGIALAATAAAAGLAQVAQIRKTTKGGGGGGGGESVDSGAGAGGGGAGQQAPGPSAGTLTVQGINPTGMFSGDVVRAMAEAFLQYQRDGGQVIIQ